jgi:hypothetical protein
MTLSKRKIEQLLNPSFFRKSSLGKSRGLNFKKTTNLLPKTALKVGKHLYYHLHIFAR